MKRGMGPHEKKTTRTSRLQNSITRTTIGPTMDSDRSTTTNPRDEQLDNASLFESDSSRTPLFGNASHAEIADDVEIAIAQLTVVRDVYDDDVLRELAALLPYEVAKDNHSVLLEKQKDGTFFVGMCFPQTFVTHRAVARALKVPVTSVHPRFLNQTRFFKLLEVAYPQRMAYPQTTHRDPSGHSRHHGPPTWRQLDAHT